MYANKMTKDARERAWEEYWERRQEQARELHYGKLHDFLHDFDEQVTLHWEHIMRCPIRNVALFLRDADQEEPFWVAGDEDFETSYILEIDQDLYVVYYDDGYNEEYLMETEDIDEAMAVIQDHINGDW